MQPINTTCILKMLSLLAICFAIFIGNANAQIDNPTWKKFVEDAKTLYGKDGEKAALFLRENSPPYDAKLELEFLLDNLKYAMKARTEFPWCAALPEAIFFNDVLPFAVLDEKRHPWRQQFYELAKEIVKDCKTASDAAQALNQHIFNKINVHYNTGRKKPNQSPQESIAQGIATCTGLSIILVDACRAVGVPARVAGIALWPNKTGNHNWVEVWDGEWRFTGADEYDAKGLNRGWFAGGTKGAIEDNWKHAIWASSWKKSAHHFPMVWDLNNKHVPGINVTERYAGKKNKSAKKEAIVFIRIWESDGKRIAAEAKFVNQNGELIGSLLSKAGRKDLNDMPMIKLVAGQNYSILIRHNGESRSIPFLSKAGDQTLDLRFDQASTNSAALQQISRWLNLLPEERHLSIPTLPLSQEEAKSGTQQIWEKLSSEAISERQKELDAKQITHDKWSMRWLEKSFGEKPEGGHSLWISMHGGGGAAARVNDQQWQNQIKLYAPPEGIVIAPRAPTNTWNLWHQQHIDILFDRLIENFVLLRGVNPNKIYLMGYSAGGDGVYQLAPRMADRFAAASMMAGHPNGVSPLGLYNLPFGLFVGGNDSAYKRNKVGKQYGDKLKQLAAENPGAYKNMVRIYPGLGHWMKLKDAEVLPWMHNFTRNPWPKKIVWHQTSRTHPRFYWLAVKEQIVSCKLEALVNQQTIQITCETPKGKELTGVWLRLSDELINLNKEINVFYNGTLAFRGKVQRDVASIHESLLERLDPKSVSTAKIWIPAQKKRWRL